MAEPTDKHPEIEAYFEETYGRTTAITTDRCVSTPIGCGGPATEFRDDLSRKEYRISGLCQSCQDGIWPEEGS